MFRVEEEAKQQGTSKMHVVSIAGGRTVLKLYRPFKTPVASIVQDYRTNCILCLGTGLYDLFVVFSVILCKYPDNTSIRLRPLPSKSFPIHQQLSQRSTKCSLATNSVAKRCSSDKLYEMRRWFSLQELSNS
jgi:hypothetical protein